jgi:hypothetical protein
MVEVLKEIRAKSFGRFRFVEISRDSWRSLEISGDLWRFAVNLQEIDRFSDDSQKNQVNVRSYVWQVA